MTIISGMPVVAGQERSDAASGRGATTVARDPNRRPTAPAVAGAVRDDGPFVVLLGATFVLCLFLLRPGHDWGDDFALYIHQAKALAQGDVQALYRQNQFTVEQSAWQPSAPTPTAGASRCSWRRSTPCSASASPPSRPSRSSSTSASSPAFYALIRNRIDRLAALLIIARHRPRHPLHVVDQHRPHRVPLPLLRHGRPAAHRRAAPPGGWPSWPPTLRALLRLAGLGVLHRLHDEHPHRGHRSCCWPSPPASSSSSSSTAARGAARWVRSAGHRWPSRGRRPSSSALGMRLLLPDRLRPGTEAGRRSRRPQLQDERRLLPHHAGRAAGRQGPDVHGTMLLGLLVFLIVLALGGMVLGGRRDLPLSVFTLGLSAGLHGAALPGGSLPARRGALPPVLRRRRACGGPTSAAGASSPATCCC